MANIIAVIDGLPIDLDLLDNGGHLDPVVFRGGTYHRWAAYYAAFTWQAGQSVAQAASSYAATSPTAISVGIGEKLLNIGPNKGYQPGQVIVVRSASDPNVWMTGKVTAYDNATGALALEVLPGGYQGSGSYSDWTVSLGGERGPQGESGTGGAPYLWSAATAAADPGAGWLGGNGADLSAVTALYASTTANGGGDVAALLDWMGQSTNPVKGLVWLTARENPARWAAFRIISVAGAGGFRTVTVAFSAASSATPFIAGDQIGLAVLRAGDRGAQGPAGSGSTVMTQSEGVDVGIAALLNFGAAFDLTFNSGTGQLDIGLKPEALATVGEVKQSALPPGVGWLECDGSSYAKADYPALAAGLGDLKTLGTVWYPRTLPSNSQTPPVRIGIYAGGKHVVLGKTPTPEVSSDTVNWAEAITWTGGYLTSVYTAIAAASVAGSVCYVIAFPRQSGDAGAILKAGSDARAWSISVSQGAMGALNYNIENSIALSRVSDGSGEAIAVWYAIGSSTAQLGLSVDGGVTWTPSYTYYTTVFLPITLCPGPSYALGIGEKSDGTRGLLKIYIDRSGAPNPRAMGTLIGGLPSGKWRTIVHNADQAFWMVAEEGTSRVAISRDADAQDWDVTDAPIAGDITSMASVGGLIVATSASHDLAMIYDGSRWSQSKLPASQNGYPLVLPGNNAVLAFADNHPDARIACLSPVRHYDPATHFAVPALDTPGGALAANSVRAYINGGVS